MAQQEINLGASPNDRTGDTWRAGGEKINDNFTELYQNLPSVQVGVNTKADLPAPVLGVITLSDNTHYRIGSKIALGTDRIVIGSNTFIKGVNNLDTGLSYSGTGDMFTMTDVTCGFDDLELDCPSGRVFNWNNASARVLRVTDTRIVACNKFGLFNSTAGGVMRFTNVSPSSITADGLEFTGNWSSFLWEVSAASITNGALFNLGTATFDSFILDTILGNLGAGTFLIDGASGSANINPGGAGYVTVMRLSGSGTPLNGVSVEDALWEFWANDDIANTRPDGLLSLQNNATATVIPAGGTYALIAGTWVVERTSQHTGTAAGRLTYDGGKPFVTPISASCSVEPVSGTNKDITIRFAIDGTPIANSSRTARVDSGSPSSITAIWQEELLPTNYVEVFVTSADGTNVLVSSAILRVN